MTPCLPSALKNELLHLFVYVHLLRVESFKTFGEFKKYFLVTLTIQASGTQRGCSLGFKQGSFLEACSDCIEFGTRFVNRHVLLSKVVSL